MSSLKVSPELSLFHLLMNTSLVCLTPFPLLLAQWPYQALALQQFESNHCYQKTDPSQDNFRYSGNSTAAGCGLSGKDVIDTLDVGELNKWLCCLVLVALGLMYRFGFYLALRASSNSKRK